MKNTKILMLALISMFAFASATAQTLKTPAPSSTQEFKQDFALGQITVNYSRPSIKGRTVFGDLVPFGSVWRTGANASTKITFTDKVKFEGKDVAAGTYAIYTVPNKDSWDIMLYSDLKLNGNVAEYKTENEVLRVTVKPTTVAEKVETFTMNINDVKADSATLELVWENTRVPVQITAQIDEAIMKNIETVMAVDARPYFSAARYYYENNKDMKKALEWINKAVEQNPKAYWVMLVKGKIEMKLADKKAALASANKTKELASADKNEDYVKMADALIKEASAK
jgi:hypothetical protein